MTGQRSLGEIKVSKKHATFEWRKAAETVAVLEAEEEKLRAELKGVTEALKEKRAIERSCKLTLLEVLDAEDPLLAGMGPREQPE